MRPQTFAAIVVTISLGATSAFAQNTNPGAHPQAKPAQTQPALADPQATGQTPPSNGSAAGGPTTATTATAGAQAEPPSGKNAEIGTATINPTGIPPSQRNPLLADNGGVRISKLIGSTIYNKDDQKLGSVDDVLAAQNGQLQVVISTNKSNKNIVVPWDDLVFGDAKLNSDNKVLMPDATEAQLDKMQAFNYQQTNKTKK